MSAPSERKGTLAAYSLSRRRPQPLPSQIKLLWGTAAVCAEPSCKILLVVDAKAHDPRATIGEMAHMVAHSDSGPRADPSYPAEKRELAENLVLLCPTHHAVVDAQDSTFTVDTLRAWKRDSERFAQEAIGARVREVGFEELDRVARALLVTPALPAERIDLPLKPREKLALNGLTAQIEQQLNIGYMRSQDVQDFLARTETSEPGFAERLVAGFREEYRRLSEDGLAGDALFFALANWTAQGEATLDAMAAGIAVLTYLFHICEVFES